MGWKNLPPDVPLDHEQLQPPQQAMGTDQPDPADDTPANLTELPADAVLDQDQPPPIVGHVRNGPTRKGTVTIEEDPKAQEETPTYTVAGFDGEVAPDRQYHTGLSEDDRKEYAQFFKDPKHPPSAAQLQLWYHEKTGALLGNAQQIVDIFKKTGKFNTAEKLGIPTKHQGATAAGINHAANGLALDWGPEAAGVLDTIGLGGEDRPNIWNSDTSLSDLWANNADLERAQLEQDATDYPIASGVGELGGVALSSALTHKAANAAGMGKLAESQGEFNRTLVQGAGEGAALGAGAAGPGNRGEGAAIGAATVPVVAGMAKLPVTVADAGKSVLQGSPGLAKRIIAKAIKDDANTPDSVGQMITDAHGNNVPLALGDTGENVRGLMAASARASGVGRTVVRDALTERQAGLADRITQHIERDLGPVANPHEVADKLMTQARDAAAPLYEAAYAKPGALQFVEKVKPLLERPSMRKAMSKAYRIAQEEGRDPESLGFVMDKDGNVKLSDDITLGEDEAGSLTMTREPVTKKSASWQTLDYIKRGMDDVVEGYRDTTTGKLHLDTEGRAINNTLRSYLQAFDAANPEYAAARNAYSGPVSAISAMNLGRKALNMTADDLEARIRDLTPANKQMFALGMRRAMAELVQSKGDTADIVHALVGTGKKRAMLARAFGDRKQFQRFVETLGQEREGWRSLRQALLGSPTASNLSDDAALEGAAMAADFAAGGMPVATATSKAIKFLRFKLGEKAQQQIAALLSNTDPAAIRELAAELRAQAEKRGLRVRKVNAATNAVGKGALAVSSQ
jgi:hypothetical protein